MIWAVLALLVAVGFGAWWLLSRLPLAALALGAVLAFAPLAGDCGRLAPGDLTPDVLVIVTPAPSQRPSSTGSSARSCQRPG